jgi:hypothetical protein
VKLAYPRRFDTYFVKGITFTETDYLVWAEAATFVSKLPLEDEDQLNAIRQQFAETAYQIISQKASQGDLV